MTSFNAETVELQGLNLIEASAGTGKTYTLAELYLRLVLEKDLPVKQILVVTYTRAATEELRDRLRQKLVDAREQLLLPADERSMLSHIDEQKQADVYNKLMRAIQDFDEAAIFTIHGFCQRVLTDYAFESGLQFDLELIGDDVALLQAATDDFWRREIASSEQQDLASYLVSKRESPETLLRSVRNLVGKPYIESLIAEPQDINEIGVKLQQQFEKVQKIYLHERDDIVATLNNKTLLNGNKYRTTSVVKWFKELDNLLAHSRSPATLFDDYLRFSRQKLDDALKKGQVLPELLFWPEYDVFLDYFHTMQQARELQLQMLRLQLLNYLRETLPQQKTSQQVQSYDDLLINLEKALNGRQGDWLVETLRKDYQAALIDEFQDTDPVQYASFNRIYADSGLATFLVGDPKQAIYSFRGADIFTYLKAKKSAQHHYSLETNWRSHHQLVTAINSLFMRREQPFIYQDIPFHSVKSARNEAPALTTINHDDAALQFQWFDSVKPMTKKDLSELAAKTTSDEIARLLNSAQAGKATLYDEKIAKDRVLIGGDIAVLVRNHRQATALQQCLQQRGINSVQQGRDNVFTSPQALIMQQILLAVAEPSNMARVSLALASPLWGHNASELYDLQQDEQKWHQQLDVFYELHQLWLNHGFMRLFRQIMVQTSVQQKLLLQSNGDRQLTNFNHIAELIQAQCVNNDTMDAILLWLAEHIESAEPNDEKAQLRLENDEQLVKIITIHKSKGLEYPIVFCPFLWDVNLRSAKETVISFHQDDDSKQACAAFSEPALSVAAINVANEEQAEELRLLYVALTRARERCIIVWANVKGRSDGQHVSDSALFSLLHPTLTELDSDTMKLQLTVLAGQSEQAISVQTVNNQDDVIYVSEQNHTEELAARKFKRTLYPPWRIGSFSALAHGHDAELPDYDNHSDVLVETAAVPVYTAMDRFSFPRGAQAGTCLHALYEYWDFASDDVDAMNDLVSRTLLQYGFDEKWQPVASQWLAEVLATPLNEQGLSLGKLERSQRLDELAFYFPVANLSVKKLQQALLPLMTKHSALKTVIQQLRFHDLSGFMKGFIDLVFEHQGRYYIVDYKSNHLGYDAKDYQNEQLATAMVSHDYPLQYLIYTLALHRYLALRLADYDPIKHLGGAYYLFIRGMKSEWGQAGIFYDKVDTELLMAFDHCLQGIVDE